MKKNLHSIDRLVRIILALVFAFLIFTGTLAGTTGTVIGVLAIVLLVTGVISFCPIYKALGISTLKEKTKTV